MLVAECHKRSVIAEKLIRWLVTCIKLEKRTEKPTGERNKSLKVLNPHCFAQLLSRGLILGYRYVVELLAEAVTFIEKLESHLQTTRIIPQIPNIMKNMVSIKRTEPSVSPSIKNSMLFGCLGYFYVLLE